MQKKKSITRIIPDITNIQEALNLYTQYQQDPTTDTYLLPPTHISCPDTIKLNTINLSPLCKNIEITQSFLIKRLGQIERIKTRTIFTIFFTNKKYMALAKKVKNYLMAQNKLAYLIYLEDVSYERMTCVDNAEVIVLVMCENCFPFENDVMVPVVCPFDVQMAFDEFEWDGSYKPNRFDTVECDKLVKFSNNIRLWNDFKKVFIYVEKEVEGDDEVGEGRNGIASGYENEGK